VSLYFGFFHSHTNGYESERGLNVIRKRSALGLPQTEARTPVSGVSKRASGNLQTPPSSCGPLATRDIRKLSKRGSLEMALSSESNRRTRDPAADTYRSTWKFRFSQMSNVQRSSRSGLDCQCVAIDIDLKDVRIPSPVRLNDLGRMRGTLIGGVNFTHGARGIVWLTGVSTSLNAVSGLSAMGTTEMKMTAVVRRSKNIHSVRFTTSTPRMALEPYCVGSSLSSPAGQLPSRWDRESANTTRRQ
jgi:hypothetical protein